jgi:hypothetical protein
MHVLPAESKEMTDLEITRLCAEAMGFTLRRGPPKFEYIETEPDGDYYDPLHNAAQCFALIETLLLSIQDPSFSTSGVNWCVDAPFGCITSDKPDLKRAICECVASMQIAKRIRSESK